MILKINITTILTAMLITPFMAYFFGSLSFLLLEVFDSHSFNINVGTMIKGIVAVNLKTGPIGLRSIINKPKDPTTEDSNPAIGPNIRKLMIQIQDVGSKRAIPHNAPIFEALIIGESTNATTAESAPNIAPPANCMMNWDLLDLTTFVSPVFISDIFTSNL